MPPAVKRPYDNSRRQAQVQATRLRIIEAAKVLFIANGYPVNVLNPIKQVPEVCSIFCATANPVEIIVAETEFGRGIVGVIDGLPPAGVETEDDIAERKLLLRTIGYKL